MARCKMPPGGGAGKKSPSPRRLRALIGLYASGSSIAAASIFPPCPPLDRLGRKRSLLPKSGRPKRRYPVEGGRGLSLIEGGVDRAFGSLLCGSLLTAKWQLQALSCGSTGDNLVECRVRRALPEVDHHPDGTNWATLLCRVPTPRRSQVPRDHMPLIWLPGIRVQEAGPHSGMLWVSCRSRV